MTDDDINASTHAAVAAYHADDKTTAAALCEDILRTMPTHPYALNLLAVITMERGQFDAALDLFDRALVAHPDLQQAKDNLAVCVGRIDQSLKTTLAESQEDFLKRQLSYAQRFSCFKHSDHWLRLAYCYFQAGRLRDAIAVYEDADHHGVATDSLYGNLGAHWQDLGDWGQAETAYLRALSLNASHAGTLYNLGSLLILQHRHFEAEAYLRQSLAANPSAANTHVALGHLLVQSNHMDEAMQCFETAIDLEPNSSVPVCAKLFNLAYLPSTTAADMLTCALQAAQHFEQANSLQAAPRLARQPDPLRIGFVSGDFKDHPVGYFLENLLRHVDRTRFEWHVFSNFEATDAVAHRLRELATSWQVIAGLSDDAAKALIAAQGIDVLIDLSGHTALHRLSLFAQRAAAIQISWLGWHDTTGLSNMDYLLTDKASMPPSRQPDRTQWISEQPLYLPRTRLCMMPPDFDLPVSPQPAQNKGFITYGAMQILAKFSDVSLAQWGRILHAVPTARLVIRTNQFRETHLLESFRTKALAMGLPMDRVDLLPPLGRGDYLASFANIDILLDTYPYPGGTTTAEALWMGVPTITMGGSTMISMQGVSLLTAAGLTNWIATSQDDYVGKAVYWAEHVADLALLRRNLRDQISNTALFDGTQFARDFEAAITSAISVI